MPPSNLSYMLLNSVQKLSFVLLHSVLIPFIHAAKLRPKTFHLYCYTFHLKTFRPWYYTPSMTSVVDVACTVTPESWLSGVLDTAVCCQHRRVNFQTLKASHFFEDIISNYGWTMLTKVLEAQTHSLGLRKETLWGAVSWTPPSQLQISTS